MKVRPRPSSLSNLDPEAFEASVQRLSLPAFAAGRRILGSQGFEIVANQSRQGRVAFDRHLSHLLDEIII